MAQDLPDNPREFLREFQAILRFQPLFCDWISRAGRLDELAELGLTFGQAEEVLLNALNENHAQGDLQPDDHEPDTGKVAVFKCPIDPTTDAYAKIGLRVTKSKSGQLRAVIWSFKRWT